MKPKQDGPAPDERADSSADSTPLSSSERWSPLSTPAAKWSWSLMAIFSAIYFLVAVLTSKEAANLAATMILGLPLGFILGISLIISGLVITRIYLSRIEG